MPLYDVADLSTVWIQAQVYEDDLAFLPTEQSHKSAHTSLKNLAVTATTRAYPEEIFTGNLAFIYPHVDQETRTVVVRFEIANPEHKLRPGSTANVKLKVAPKDVRVVAQSVAGVTNVVPQEMLAHGRVLAVPEQAVIDTGRETIVYRQSLPGVFEGVLVKLGPKMLGPEGVRYFPVLGGLELGETIVSTGSFLVDAETRLNPAAGSIYFGGSGGSKTAPAAPTVRPSTPADADAKIAAALAKLPPSDRALAASQKFCPVLSGSRLGAMGVPIKLDVNGQAVFVCCGACRKGALDKPQETLSKVEALRRGEPVPEGTGSKP